MVSELVQRINEISVVLKLIKIVVITADKVDRSRDKFGKNGQTRGSNNGLFFLRL